MRDQEFAQKEHEHPEQRQNGQEYEYGAFLLAGHRNQGDDSASQPTDETEPGAAG